MRAQIYLRFINTYLHYLSKNPFSKKTRYPNLCSGHISIEPSESRRCIAPPRQ